jgi:hypothetical protein
VLATRLDGDAIPDLVTINVNGDHPDGRAGKGTASVLIGRGDGSFAAPAHYPSAQGYGFPAFAIAADLDGDRIADLAVSNNNVGSIGILLGRGDGSFRDVVTTPAGESPAGLDAADVNGDRAIDLLLCSSAGTQGGASVLLGNGDGSFGPPVRIVSGSMYDSCLLVDLDGDGRPDAVASDAWEDRIAVLFGHGDGSFAQAIFYRVGGTPRGIAAADFDRDGRIDLAVANQTSDDVSVLFGRTDGTLDPARNHPVGGSAMDVSVGDFDRDGWPDLAVAAGEDGFVILHNLRL